MNKHTQQKTLSSFHQMHQPDAERKMESHFTEEQESFCSVMPVAVEAILTVFFSPLSWIDVF